MAVPPPPPPPRRIWRYLETFWLSRLGGVLRALRHQGRGSMSCSAQESPRDKERIGPKHQPCPGGKAPVSPQVSILKPDSAHASLLLKGLHIISESASPLAFKFFQNFPKVAPPAASLMTPHGNPSFSQPWACTSPCVSSSQLASL